MMYSEMLSFGGATLCGLVGVKFFATVADSLQRYSADKRRFRLQNAALQRELDRLARVSVERSDKFAWEGLRKFRVHSKVREIDGCHSIYLAPHDGKPLPKFHPGQFLTFSVRVPGQSKLLVRCYSLSDCSSDQYYRCTVKKVLPPSAEHPSGIVSSYFNEQLKEGDLLDVKAPRGGFYLDMTREDPVVLLAAGVGITPLLAMVNAVAASGSRRTVHMFCAFRNSSEHLFKQHLKLLADEVPNVHVHTLYSQPDESDVFGQDYDAAGYVSLDLLKSKLPSNNFDYYLCGPSPFMNTVQGILSDWGVPSGAIHSEAFGPASIKKPAKPRGAPAPKPANQVKVSFTRSGVAVPWDPESETLLDLAEKHNVAIDSGCRAGNCGTCVVGVKNGSVNYKQEPDGEIESGSCLACIATPDSNLELDA